MFMFATATADVITRTLGPDDIFMATVVDPIGGQVAIGSEEELPVSFTTTV
jgi:hypothetical protein